MPPNNYTADYIKFEKCTAGESLKIILWLTGICALSYVLIVYAPLEILFTYLGIENSNGCTLYTLFGFPCPACGLGRGFSAVINLKYPLMFYYNPSALFIYIFSFIVIAVILVSALFRYKIKLMPKLLKLWYIPVILLIIIWVLNLLYGHHEHTPPHAP